MAKEREKKKYKVTVTYEEHTPEEAELIEKQITNTIRRIKLDLMRAKREKEWQQQDT